MGERRNRCIEVQIIQEHRKLTREIQDFIAEAPGTDFTGGWQEASDALQAL